MFGCNPLEIVTPCSGPKGLHQKFAGVSCFWHSCVYPANSVSIWLCEGHEKSRRWQPCPYWGSYTLASTFHPVQPLPRLIFGTWTVFLGLLLVFQIIHLVDSVCTQERRFGVIGAGHWGYAAAFWDGVLGWAADTCKNILLGFSHLCVEKAL